MSNARTQAMTLADRMIRFLLVVVLSFWAAHWGMSAQNGYSDGSQDQTVSERMPQIVAHPSEQPCIRAEQKGHADLTDGGGVCGILPQTAVLLPPDDWRVWELPIRAPPHVGRASVRPDTRAPPHLI